MKKEFSYGKVLNWKWAFEKIKKASKDVFFYEKILEFKT